MYRLYFLSSCIISIVTISSCKQTQIAPVVEPNPFVFKRGWIQCKVEGKFNTDPNTIRTEVFSIQSFACYSDSNLSKKVPQEFNVLDCNNYSTPTSSRNVSIYGVTADKGKKIVSLIGHSGNSSSNFPSNIPNYSSSSLDVSITNAIYSDYQDSVVVSYFGKALNDIQLQVKSSNSGSNTYGSSGSTFVTSENFATENYIKIVLYKK